MKNKHLILSATMALAGFLNESNATTLTLGSADTFAVLGGSTVTSTGNTVLNGNLGIAPGTSTTGFPPGIVNGTTHRADGVAAQAQADALTAYNTLAGEMRNATLTGQDLGGLTLTPGVYFFYLVSATDGSAYAQRNGRLYFSDWKHAYDRQQFVCSPDERSSSRQRILANRLFRDSRHKHQVLWQYSR